MENERSKKSKVISTFFFEIFTIFEIFRHYEVADENSLPDIISEVIKVLTCDFMGVTLSNLSGLGLHPTCKKKIDDDDDDDEDDEDDDEDCDPNDDEDDDDDGSLNDDNSNDDVIQKVSDDSKPGTSKSLHVDNKNEESDEPVKKKTKNEASNETDEVDETEKSISTCHVEVRRWKTGHYTLVTDDDHELQLSALDANLFFNINDDWNEDCGGNVSYIARDEDDEVSLMRKRIILKIFFFSAVECISREELPFVSVS
jgi:hypothetical protein